MKWVRTAIGAVIAISVIPVIILTVIHVTELKDVKNVQFELLSEEDGNFFITPGTYNKLIENKNIINYDIESNYTLITHEELDRGTWRLNEELYNELIDRETNPRIVENVGKLVFNGSEDWIKYSDGLFYVLNEIENFPFVTNVVRDDFVSNLYENTCHYLILNNIEEDKVIAINDKGLFSVSSVFVRDNQFNTVNEFKQYLSENPLTVYYELAVKNPKTKVIEDSDIISITTSYPNLDYIKISKPLDYIGYGNFDYRDSFILGDYEVITAGEFGSVEHINAIVGYAHADGFWLGVEKGSHTIQSARNLLRGKILTYELAQPRPAEQYDLSSFKLTFDDDRIRILFDIDEGYYLWEITNDDRLIPINGQHEIGNVWTVKFYIYEIQQPLIRSLVLLIPLIVISGLLLYLFKLVKERG